MPEAATPGTAGDPATATATDPATTAAASSATTPSAAAAATAAASRQRGRSGPAQHQARDAECRDEIDSEQSGYRQATRNKFSHPVPGHFLVPFDLCEA
jgi:Ni/Co efflux regulator RcnB